MKSADSTPLPRRVRAARLLLLLPLPILAFMLMSLPMPPAGRGEWQSWIVLVLELLLAVSCFVGLGRRRDWGWKLAAGLGIAAALLCVRALSILFGAGQGGAHTAPPLPMVIAAVPQVMLAAAGLLAWQSRRELAMPRERGGA
jgi:hypothetical protein